MDAQGHLRLMESAMEEWRPVVGYEGLYEVSSEGRVRSLTTGNTLRPFVATNGYYMLGLKKNGKRTTKTIHGLVCSAFHGARKDGMCARHLNGNPLDNRAKNLAWGTYKDNAKDAVVHGTKKRPYSIPESVARHIRTSARPLHELASVYDIHHHHAWQIRTGKSRKGAA